MAKILWNGTITSSCRVPLCKSSPNRACPCQLFRRSCCYCVVALAIALLHGCAESPKPGQIIRIDHGERVLSVEVSPSGETIVSASEHTIRISDKDGNELRVRSVPESPLAGWFGAISFLDKYKFIATTPSRRIHVFDADNDDIGDDSHHFGDGSSSAVSFGGKLVAIANRSTVRLYNAQTNQHMSEITLKPIFTRVNDLAFSRCGKLLAAGLRSYGQHSNEGPLVRVWDVASSTEVCSGWWYGGEVNTVDISPDDKFLAAGGWRDGRGIVEVYDLSRNEIKSRILADQYGVFCLLISANGKTLYTGGNDAEIKVWKFPSGGSRGFLKGHHDQVKSISRSADGKVMASGSRDNSVIVWRDLE